jgi:hypothetical protein
MELNWNNEDQDDIDIDDVMKNTGISLEPRLQEYLNKRNYYKLHNIEPEISLTKEYRITSEDKKILIAFIKSDKDIYNANRAKQSKINLEIVDGSNQYFPSSKFKKDPRLEKIKEKQKRDKDSIKQRHNYNNYDNYAFSTPTIDDNYKAERNDAFDTPVFLDSRDFNFDSQQGHNYKPDKITKQHTQPKLQYKQTQPFEKLNSGKQCIPHDDTVDKIIGDLDTYSNHVNTIYQDTKHINTNQKVDQNKSYINTARYQPIPYLGSKAGLRDINMESNIQCGYTTTGKRSYGYEASAEHSFDYINPDLQKPEHVVMPFPRGGIDTRRDNHSAKPYKRDILN